METNSQGFPMTKTAWTLSENLSQSGLAWRALTRAAHSVQCPTSMGTALPSLPGEKPRLSLSLVSDNTAGSTCVTFIGFDFSIELFFTGQGMKDEGKTDQSQRHLECWDG